MTERTALYRLYDTNGKLLYIGITRNLNTRWYTHAREKDWWPKVVRKEVEWFETREEADRAERAEVLRWRPKFNRTYNPGRARELYNEANAKKRLGQPVVLPDPGWSPSGRTSGSHPEMWW